MTAARDRVAAALGALGVAGNVAGVAALAGVPAAYRPAGLDAWAAQAAAHPAASAASAVAFTVGLLALAGWARALGAGAGPWSRAAASAIAAGAAANAAGCVAPLVWAVHVAPACSAPAACGPAARALLGLTLALDALFNLLLGAGLLVLGGALLRAGARRLGGLGLAAGLATLPVSLQVTSEAAARLLALAAPLWLLFVAASSVRLWRAAEGNR